jgi:rare lipoprotein A
MRCATRGLALAVLAALVAACSTTRAPRESPSTTGKSGYYKDDGPADAVPSDLDALPDAIPRREPLHRFANRPYVVFGREYVPATSLRRYRERGIASWYGRKFHGARTATGETYDMFAMTAAHPTLPIPSYARVTNVATGKSVIVRVNDRGPFLNDRVIDLSYAAAHRIGIAQRGSGEVEVESIVFDDILTASAAPLPPVTIAAAGPAVAASPVALPNAAAVPNAATAPVVAAAAPAVAPVSTDVVAIPITPSPVVAAERRLDAALPTPGDAVPVAPLGGGFVVQLGAFSNNANAQAFVSRLANQWPERRVEAQVRQVNGLFRVYVGPYVTRDDARREADRLRSELGLPSTIAAH